MSTKNKSYILSYCIKTGQSFKDGWEVHEDLESARSEYEALLERDDLYSACISEGIIGTDI